MSQKFDVVQSWLDNVAISHSGSQSTAYEYRRDINRFCKFIDKSPEQILAEYEGSNERDFKRKYAQYLRGLISSLMRQGYTSKSIRVIIGAVQSFFKYNDLTLGHIPSARDSVTFHNRDITKEEIQAILNISSPRDRAFFALSAQSGIRPFTICQLKLKHIEPDFSKEVIPCKIEVPQEIAKGKYRSYFTFVGDDALHHLKNYLNTRANLTPESYLFTLHGKEEPVDRRNITHRFRDAALKLKKKGLIDFGQKTKGKPSEIRLYNLRKWFRKQAHQAGFEIVQFWMGHVVREGQEENYRPTDVEFHRKLFAEKAMPYLRLEAAQPIESEKAISRLETELETKTKEIQSLQETVEKMQPLLSFIEDMKGQDGMRIFIKSWIETELYRRASEQGKKVPQQYQLTEAEQGIFSQTVDDISIKLSEALQKIMGMTIEGLSENKKKLLEGAK